MLEQYGYKADFAEKCIYNNKHNQVTTIYYLIHKRYEKQGLLPSHFNIHDKKEEPIKEVPKPSLPQAQEGKVQLKPKFNKNK
jgi:hypothetical protein